MSKAKQKAKSIGITLLPGQSNGAQDKSKRSSQYSFDELEKKLDNMSNVDAVQLSRLKEFLAKKQQIGVLRAEDFTKQKELGAGNGGVVISVLHNPTNTVMARKLIHLEVNQETRKGIVTELEVLHQCNSPYIVNYFGAFYADGEINICMECMDGGSLDLILRESGRLPEPILGKITEAVLNGLGYLRAELGKMHRDVKPSNILVNSKGEIKLCDFGVSGTLIDSMANSFVGTRSYMSPERLMGQEYTVQSDIWSMGLALVELALGQYPIPPPNPTDVRKVFGDDTPESHMEAACTGKPMGGKGLLVETRSMAIFELLNIIANEPPPKLPEKAFSPEFVDFTELCLKKTDKERGDLQTLSDHPFVKKWQAENLDIGNWVRKIKKKE